MRTIVMFVLCLASFATFGQNKNDKGKPAGQQPTQQPVQQPTAQQQQAQVQFDLLTDFFARKNALANRWNDPDVARESLFDLVTLYPGNDSLVYSLALDYYTNQKYVSSILVLQDLLARSPKNPEALQLAASGFESINISEKALEKYEALYLVNGSTVALYKMAVLQYDVKKYAESKTNVEILLTKSDIETMKVTITDSEKKQKEYSLKVAILNLKGMVAQQLGEKDTAKKAFEDALALAPDFPLAKQNLAKLK